MVQEQFDAYELEYASNPAIVKPQRRFGWFIHNRDYARYDTLACVGNLSKSVKEGDMLSQEEILNLQRPVSPDTDQVVNVRGRWRRAIKKRK